VAPQRKETPASTKRFVPASVFPYGGFGDPEVEQPYTRVPRGVDPDSVLQAAAQDRLARRVRRVLRERAMTETELEEQLGYRRYGLVRKLNGNEQLTMRDVARIGTLFDEAVVGALSSERTGIEPGTMLAEPTPSQSQQRPSVQDLVAEAAERLVEASRLVRLSGTGWRAEALARLAEVALALGEPEGERATSRKRSGPSKRRPRS
jgi:hypothetical protein